MYRITLFRPIFFVLLVVTAISVSGCVSWTAVSNHDTSAKFIEYRTFACVTNDIPERFVGVNRFAQSVIIDNIETQGMKYDSVAPDITIVAQFSTSYETRNANSGSSGYVIPSIANVNDFVGGDVNDRIAYWYGGHFSQSTTQEQSYYSWLNGKLTIFIVECSSQTIIWRGVAEGAVYSRLTLELRHSIKALLHQYGAIWSTLPP